MDEMLEFGNISPRQNPFLEGQTKAEEEFYKVLKTGRLHHAWLVSGPQGVGKATFAYRIARFMLNQSTSNTSDKDTDMELFPSKGSLEHQTETETSLYIDPKDPVFRRVATGSHVDFFSVERGIDDKTKNRRKEILVQDVRAIGSFLNKTAAEANWRVVVIDAVDEMNISAANALLKVLEEPPKQALLILVSHNPNSLLATIRSRCRKLSLKPLDASSMTVIIKHHYPEVKKDELEFLLTFCNGSVGLALELLKNQGFRIFESVNSLLSDPTELDIPGLYSLCEEINKQPQDQVFRILHLVLGHWISQKVKTEMGKGSLKTKAVPTWIDVWENMNNLFHKAESVNLARKQVILNIFISISALVHDRSRVAT